LETWFSFEDQERFILYKPSTRIKLVGTSLIIPYPTPPHDGN